MATNSAGVRNAGGPVHWSFARFADRRIFVFTGALFIRDPGRFSTGVRLHHGGSENRPAPVPPLIVHLQAVLMGSWLLLLLVRTVRMATGRRTLGIALWTGAGHGGGRTSGGGGVQAQLCGRACQRSSSGIDAD
jgi:hypothetical protein